MRKITQNAANAFVASQPFEAGNTTVTVEVENGAITTKMFLHGNLIARKASNRDAYQVTLAGWPTVTTRERLNGLLATVNSPCRFFQKNHKQLFGNDNYNEPVFDSQWIQA